MNFPKAGDRVNIILSNGSMQAGIVNSWNEKDNEGISWTVLGALNNSGIEMCIQQYYIACFSIMNENKTVVAPMKAKAKRIKKVVEEPINSNEVNKINDQNLRARKLVELRKMRSDIKKEEIKNHIKRTDITQEQVKYELPSFTKRTQR